MLGDLDPASPDILPYDASHQANPDAADEFNRGCPVGYFAQFVGAGEPGAQPYGSAEAWVRCRKISSSTPQTIQDESAITAQEQLDIYRKAIEDTVRQFGAGLPSFGRGLVVGLVAIAVILVAWKR